MIIHILWTKLRQNRGKSTKPHTHTHTHSPEKSMDEVDEVRRRKWEGSKNFEQSGEQKSPAKRTLVCRKFAVFSSIRLFFSCQCICACACVSTFRLAIWLYLGDNISRSRSGMTQCAIHSGQITDFNAPCISHSLNGFLSHLFWKWKRTRLCQDISLSWKLYLRLGWGDVVHLTKKHLLGMLMALRNKLEKYNTYIGVCARVCISHAL